MIYKSKSSGQDEQDEENAIVMLHFLHIRSSSYTKRSHT